MITVKRISPSATFDIDEDGMYRGRLLVNGEPFTPWTDWAYVRKGNTFSVVGAGYYPGMSAEIEKQGGKCCCKSKCSCQVI